MYRIELKPGEVTVFRTIEELATGVRNGVISPKARIYHNASEKWLPIEFHPHYKQALDLLAGRTSELPTPKPVERPRTDTLSFLTPAPTPAPKPAEPPRADTLSFLTPAPTPAPKPAEPPRADTRGFLAPAPKPAEPPRTDTLSFLSAAPTPAVTTRTPAPAAVTPRADAQATMAPVITTQVLIEEESVEEESVEEEPVEEESVEEEPAEVLADMPFAALPRVSASPVLDLPTISYPEITPLEQPVAVEASRASQSRRPLHLAGAVLVLALGGYASSSLLSGFTGAATIADRPTVPASFPVTPAASAAKPTPSPKPGTSAPLGASVGAPSPASAPLPPASSGFARALESRAIVSTPAKTGDSRPTGTAADSATIEPPPIDLDVAVPTLPGAESLAGAPRAQGDSAMKKILRAVNGGKDIPQKP